MKARLKLAIAGACMAAFVAFAVGCSAAPGSEVQIAEGSAEFSQGDLVVKLDANPTTGYEWTFQIDGSAVQPDGDEFVPASDGATAMSATRMVTITPTMVSAMRVRLFGVASRYAMAPRSR